MALSRPITQMYNQYQLMCLKNCESKGYAPINSLYPAKKIITLFVFSTFTVRSQNTIYSGYN